MHDTIQSSTPNHVMKEELALGFSASTLVESSFSQRCLHSSLEICFQKKEIAALLLTGW